MPTEEVKSEIFAVEKQFNTSCKEKGIATAFFEFAAENAVIKREEDTIISGKEAIRDYYEKSIYNGAQVEWVPDVVEVSEDGTMASTFGKYTWTIVDENGDKKVYTGVFHTVWKRQKDSTWKYIWD